MAKLELSRDLSMSPEDAWAHVSDLSTLGDWLSMHEGWRSDLPSELEVGTQIVGVAGAKGMRNRVKWTIREFDPPRLIGITGDGVGGTKYKLQMTVAPTKEGVLIQDEDGTRWRAAVRADRDGRSTGREG